MKLELGRYLPPGLDPKQERLIFNVGFVCSAFYSLGFFIRYSAARRDLYMWQGNERVLIPDAVMIPFSTVLGSALVGFYIVAVCMLGVIAWHYIYHRQGGSMSVYLMRRLPKRWEMHRRCLSLPLLAVACCLLCAFLLLAIYFGVYMAFTPEECIAPGQWSGIWRG